MDGAVDVDDSGALLLRPSDSGEVMLTRSPGLGLGLGLGLGSPEGGGEGRGASKGPRMPLLLTV